MIKFLTLASICLGHICIDTRDSPPSCHHSHDPTRDSIELNFPFSSNYFKENSTYRKEEENGFFSLSLPHSVPKIVLLRYHEKERWVLLSPKRTLLVRPDLTDTADIFNMSGVGKAENEVLERLTPRSGLWFSADIARNGNEYTGKNPYVFWSKDSLIRYLYPLIKQSLDSSQQLIARTTVPEPVRNTLATEAKYYYANELNKLVRGWALARHNSEAMASHFNQLQWAELGFFNMPTPKELEISQSAKVWLNNYLELKYSQRLDTATSDPDKEHGRKVYGEIIGVSWEQYQKLIPIKGPGYLAIVVERRNILPAYGEERRLADIACRGAKDDPALGKIVLQDIIKDFPNSKYIELCRKRIGAMEKLKKQNVKDQEIRFVKNTGSINSLAELLAPYKGKTVYLDLWGTWCGPCIKEINNSTELKRRFKDKNVVFLYLDRDEDKDDGKWKDFIYVHDLTGEHVRMNAGQIKKIWSDLGEPSQSYPRYYIFDKDGSLVLKNASRPSDGEYLYTQLNAALSK